MTTHLSTRLVWHDRAWDGCVCDSPSTNAYCLVHVHVRDSRDDAAETSAAGTPLSELDGWQPPCSRDPMAFSPRGFTITHHDPLEFRNLPSAVEEIPPYSVCPSPYRWMREENVRAICEQEKFDLRGPSDAKREYGWVFEPERQLSLLTNFWDKLKKGKSLIFFYCNHGNPLDEKLSRILLGVGRISEIGRQHYFGKKLPKYPDEYPVWSRCITHDFVNEGFRLPYHEYLRAGHDPTSIICRIPDSAQLEFSYVAEHVNDDLAVGALERLVQSVQTVKDEGKVEGEWNRHLEWLNDVLSEVWRGRGPFPGVGSVLQYLGFASGTAFHRQVLFPLIEKGENAWEYVQAVLEGRRTCEDNRYVAGLRKAGHRWRMYSESRRRLLSLLVRFELSPEQVERVANPDQRETAGIAVKDADLLANPYLICEMDQGTSKSEPIALETIDHGMRPEGEAARFLAEDDALPHDDQRRVRGVAVAILQAAAQEGDTVLPLGEAIVRINKRFPDRRACRPDRELVVGQADFYQQVLHFPAEGDSPTMALKHLAELEQEVGIRLARRLKKRNDPPRSGWNWEDLLKQAFEEGEGSKLSPEIEERARKEKAEALEKLFQARFSVLYGRAGTGKTSVLKVFLNGLEELEGKSTVLLLAPTGKARVRLMDRTKRDAFTIHQFLMRNDWLNPDNFALRYQDGRTGWGFHGHHRRSLDDPDGSSGRSVSGLGLEQGNSSDPGRRSQPIAADWSRPPVCGHHRLAGRTGRRKAAQDLRRAVPTSLRAASPVPCPAHRTCPK